MGEKRQKKRPMRRKLSRSHREFADKEGQTFTQVRALLNAKIKRRDNRIKILKDKLASIEEDHKKDIHQLEILHRREVKKRETKIKNWEKRYREFQSKVGKKPRTVFYRTRYKYYEPPALVDKFEKTLVNVRDNVSDKHLENFEKITKILEHLDEHNYEFVTDFTINHYLLLLVLLFHKETLLGVTVSSIEIPTLTPYMIRKGINYLADKGLVDRVGKIKFKINGMGEDLLHEIRNRDSFGKSSVLEQIKKSTGMTKYEDYEDLL